jgi:radical SAM protein with 4Fe4S-binding SPASM domain
VAVTQNKLQCLEIPVTTAKYSLFKTNAPDFRHRRKRPLSAPVAINLEITSGCHLKCRHCYNFWREDSNDISDAISNEKLDFLINDIKESGVYHVVLSGGEPLIAFNTLEYALTNLTAAGISTSINSTLHQLTEKKAARLKQAGLDHVLVQLDSAIEETNDFMMNRSGILKRSIKGIKTAVAAGIRISVNMVVSNMNQNDVYETAKLCSELGVQKIFGTRLVPSVNAEDPESVEHLYLGIEESKNVVDELIRAKADFNIEIGTLISYPLCALGDLSRYADFVGRGCPAQNGNRMVINSNGESHACTHEETSYGNVFDDGIRKVFSRMSDWHDGSYLFEGCAECVYIDVCGSGCRMASNAYSKVINGKDPMWKGWADQLGVPFRADMPHSVVSEVDNCGSFYLPEDVRFRQEDGFSTLNIRWASIMQVDTIVAEFLLERRTTDVATFTLKDFEQWKIPNARTVLLGLLYKGAVSPTNSLAASDLRSRPLVGANVDPYELPSMFDGI